MYTLYKPMKKDFPILIWIFYVSYIYGIVLDFYVQIYISRNYQLKITDVVFSCVGFKVLNLKKSNIREIINHDQFALDNKKNFNILENILWNLNK